MDAHINATVRARYDCFLRALEEFCWMPTYTSTLHENIGQVGMEFSDSTQACNLREVCRRKDNEIHKLNGIIYDLKRELGETRSLCFQRHEEIYFWQKKYYKSFDMNCCMKQEQTAGNAVYNDIHDNSGPIFPGIVNQPVFVQAGATVTQNIVNQYSSPDIGSGAVATQRQEAEAKTDEAEVLQVTPAEAQTNEATPAEVSTGEAEVLQKREARRKERVLNDIIARFDFEEAVFCKDKNGKRITNARLGVLFCRCFGMSLDASSNSLVPLADNASNGNITEKLWSILIDKRKGCKKEHGEGFFRQTVLAILGGFKISGILNIGDQELTRILFKDAGPNLYKNAEREVRPNAFPFETSYWLDENIGKLKRGEI